MNQRRKSVTAIFAILKILALIVVIAVLVSVGRRAYDFGYRVFAEEAVSQYRGKMKGGNYILTTAMTAEEMLAEMSGANETETGAAE